MELSGGRCAAGRVKAKLIGRGKLNGPNHMPAGNLGEGNHAARGSRQRRSVQGLADLASRFWSALVLVEEATARSKIEQHKTEKWRDDATRSYSCRVPCGAFHSFLQLTPHLAALDVCGPAIVALQVTSGTVRLTPQRFSPKLRLTKYMAGYCANGRIVVGLLLLLLLLAAQFHFLSDLDSGRAGAHQCPVCSILSVAILLALPMLCLLPVVERVDGAHRSLLFSPAVVPPVSPRAPPVF